MDLLTTVKEARWKMFWRPYNSKVADGLILRVPYCGAATEELVDASSSRMLMQFKDRLQTEPLLQVLATVVSASSLCDDGC